MNQDKIIKPNLTKMSTDDKIKYIKQLEAAVKERDNKLSARQEDYSRMNMRFNLLKELIPRINAEEPVDQIIKKANSLVDWCREPYEAHLEKENGES